jgi:hypothetical protein
MSEMDPLLNSGRSFVWQVVNQSDVLEVWHSKLLEGVAQSTLSETNPTSVFSTRLRAWVDSCETYRSRNETGVRAPCNGRSFLQSVVPHIMALIRW